MVKATGAENRDGEKRKEPKRRPSPSRLALTFLMVMLVMWAFLPVLANGLSRWLIVLFGALAVLLVAFVLGRRNERGRREADRMTGQVAGPVKRRTSAPMRKGATDLRTYRGGRMSDGGEKITTFVCPSCGGRSLYYESGYLTGQVYHCKDCDYIGSFVIERDLGTGKMVCGSKDDQFDGDDGKRSDEAVDIPEGGQERHYLR